MTTLLRYDRETTLDLDSLTAEELEHWRLKFEEDGDVIEYQLNMAKAEQIASGRYADPRWYASAQFTLKRKHKGAELLRKVLGSRKRTQTKTERGLESYFMDVSRTHLPAATFEQLYTLALQAKARANVSSNGG